MTNEEIELLLTKALNVTDVHVRSEGTHFHIIAVSDEFAEMSRVKRQQVVYAPLKEKISDGSIHAVTIKTFTEKDWKRERMFNMPS